MIKNCLDLVSLLFLGDLLQHFLTVIFEKLDKGETWDDDFELNTMLQVTCIVAFFNKEHHLCHME